MTDDDIQYLVREVSRDQAEAFLALFQALAFALDRFGGLKKTDLIEVLRVGRTDHADGSFSAAVFDRMIRDLEGRHPEPPKQSKPDWLRGVIDGAGDDTAA